MMSMQRFHRSFAPLSDRQAPANRINTEKVRVPINGMPGHFSPEVVRSTEETQSQIAETLRPKQD